MQISPAGWFNLLKSVFSVVITLAPGQSSSTSFSKNRTLSLENNWDKLNEDHRKAKELSKILIKVRGVKKIYPVETNIIIFEFENELAATKSLSEASLVAP